MTASDARTPWLIALAAIATSTVLARAPLLGERRPYGDEALYALMGHQWLEGHAPYTILMDMKPPGIFLLFALAEAVTGDPLLAPRVLPLIAVLATAVALWRIGIAWFGDRSVALLAAVLYPPFTVVLGGTLDVSALLLAPFVAFALLLAGSPGSRAAFAAGLLIGVAGTIKHVAVFDAALGLVLIVSANRDRGAAIRPALAFCLGAATPPCGFAAYYLGIGSFEDLWAAAVVWAVVRNESYISIAEAPLRLLAMLRPVLPLVVLAAFAITERRWFRGRRRPWHWGWLAGWTAAALAGAIAQQAIYEHYLLPIVPPLTLAAALFLVELHRRARWFGSRFAFLAAIGALAAFPLAWVTVAAAWPRGDRDVHAIVAELDRLGLVRGTRDAELYVVDHEPALYLLTDTIQPTRWAYPEHLQCGIRLPPGVDPEAEIDRVMARQPRFVVVTAHRIRYACTRADRMALYAPHLAEAYILAARIGDPRNPVEILRRRDPAP